MKIGIIADVHYEPEKDEFAPPKPGEKREVKNPVLKGFYDFYENNGDCDLFINMGDFITGTGDGETDYMSVFLALRPFIGSAKKTLFVMGNHDAFHVPKDMLLRNRDDIGCAYSYLEKGILFIALDANFASDGIPYSPEHGEWTDSFIPQKQLDWFSQQLARTDYSQAVVLCHQRLDMFMDTNEMLDPHVVTNAYSVREIMLNSGKVNLVIQGHYHSGDVNDDNGITYLTQKAFYRNGGFNTSILNIDDNGCGYTIHDNHA